MKSIRTTKSRRGGRVVKGTIPSSDVARWFPANGSHIEVREKPNGSWSVWFPEEGWLPCAATCELRHSHDTEWPFRETNYQPTDYTDAMAWAGLLAEGREVKVIAYQTPAERRAATARKKVA